MTYPLPILEFAILLPLLGASCLARVRSPERSRFFCLVFAALTLISTVLASASHVLLPRLGWNQPESMVSYFVGAGLFGVDQLNTPLLPLTALLYLLTVSATLATKVKRFSFGGTLLSEAIVLATLASQQAWLIVALLAISTVPPWLELRARNRPTRVYALHMLLFVILLIVGQLLVTTMGAKPASSPWLLVPLVLAVFVRNGIAPFHCWMPDLFEHLAFGSALLFAVPMMGVYAAMRLVLPIATDGVLHTVGLLSLATAVYAAGMALVQREARRFFCYLFISHAALVLTGLETATPVGLTGALTVWLSSALSLAAFGLILRGLESRQGRLSLTVYHGLYDHTRLLAVAFLIAGMAGVGFPGTFGFIGTEMVVDGVVQVYPHFGIAIVIAAALNGIAVVKAYFLLFTGTRHVSTVPLRSRKRELIAVLLLSLLILGAGIYPQPGVLSRHSAAVELLRQRQVGLDRLAARPPNADGHHARD